MLITNFISFLIAVAVASASWIWRNIVAAYESCSQAATFVSTFKWEVVIATGLFFLGLAVISYQPFIQTGIDIVYETIIFNAEQLLVNFLLNPVKTAYQALSTRWNDVVIYYRTSLYIAITEIQALMQINSIQKVTQVFDIIYTMFKAFAMVFVNVPSLHIQYFSDALCVYYETIFCLVDIVEAIVIQLAQFTIISQDCTFCNLAPLASGPCVILTFSAPGVVIDCSNATCYRLYTDLVTCAAVFLDYVTDAQFTFYIYGIADSLGCILELWKPIFFLGQVGLD